MVRLQYTFKNSTPPYVEGQSTSARVGIALQAVSPTHANTLYASSFARHLAHRHGI